MALPLRTSTFIRGDHTFPWECDDEDGDHRFYELSYGAKVYLNFHYKSFYPNGIVQSEGTFVDGYKLESGGFLTKTVCYLSLDPITERMNAMVNGVSMRSFSVVPL